MMHIKRTLTGYKPFLLGVLLCFAASPVFSQIEEAHSAKSGEDFPAGYSLYREGRFMEAAAELRRAQESAESLDEWTETLYWLIMAELSLADYSSAFNDMDQLEKHAPESRRARDIRYHRARACYNLGYFDEAMALFKQYADLAGEGEEFRRSAAYYWIGESLMAIGLANMARDFFTLVIEQYPDSPKAHSAAWRIAEIKQTQIENDLMTLLKWREAELQRIEEEFRQREAAADAAGGVSPAQ
jgi:TolA-binding protein